MSTSLRFDGWMAIVAFGACAFASLALLMLAMRRIPLGVCYAAFTGLGAVGTVLVGALFFSEPLSVCVAHFFWS